MSVAAVAQAAVTMFDPVPIWRPAAKAAPTVPSTFPVSIFMSTVNVALVTSYVGTRSSPETKYPYLPALEHAARDELAGVHARCLSVPACRLM
jgi:hypothetical protein